jgi:hypothetical protein
MRIFGWVVLLVAGVVGLSIAGSVLHWFGRAADVVQQQTDPFELQRKYELFKDQAAALDGQVATLSLYRKRTLLAHCDTVRDRVGQEQCMVWLQEQSGIAAAYNSLAKDYNSEMSKWNFAFCNIGTLPKGASVPLPREYKPYITE